MVTQRTAYTVVTLTATVKAVLTVLTHVLYVMVDVNVCLMVKAARYVQTMVIDAVGRANLVRNASDVIVR
tara:strand:+ start:104 stop:313 length:210 start_codon:yes stop_codon:yes gene_type:complete